MKYGGGGESGGKSCRDEPAEGGQPAAAFVLFVFFVANLFS
ncbi:MAG TPA: hypothetical protein VG407_17540 [Caulobacteraceae bacterium]|jgi:hypothetical protein|nr:hypothetical protein [Caulobacteraceae bacterium]